MILAEVFKDKELHVCNLLQSNSAKKKKKTQTTAILTCMCEKEEKREDVRSWWICMGETQEFIVLNL